MSTTAAAPSGTENGESHGSKRKRASPNDHCVTLTTGVPALPQVRALRTMYLCHDYEAVNRFT